MPTVKLSPMKVAMSSEDPGGEESIRGILEEMHHKMQVLCEEISKGRMTEAEEPARRVLQSCSTLRTLTPDTPTSTPLCIHPALISGSVFGETPGPSRGRSRAQSAHSEAESFASRLARLEQQRAVDLQKLRCELREQILQDLKPELQALQLEPFADLKQLELHLRGHSKCHRFSNWEVQAEAAACEERLEVTRLALAQMQSEVTAQAELLEHVQQQMVELMSPPPMERSLSSKLKARCEKGLQAKAALARETAPLSVTESPANVGVSAPEVTGEQCGETSNSLEEMRALAKERMDEEKSRDEKDFAEGSALDEA